MIKFLLIKNMLLYCQLLIVEVKFCKYVLRNVTQNIYTCFSIKGEQMKHGRYS